MGMELENHRLQHMLGDVDYGRKTTDELHCLGY